MESAADETVANTLGSDKVWQEFCDALKKSGEQILRTEAPSDELTRAEGYRYLTRLLRIALDMFMECGDRDFPSFYRPSHETAKIGADNPDNYYLRAELDGNNEYRISGTRGSVHYLSFGTQAGGYGEDGRNEPTGFIDARQIELHADGSFELILSKEKHPGNWLPMTAATKTVIVRQTFLDRNIEQPAEIKIARVNTIGKATCVPAPLTATKLATALQSTAAFVNGTANLFADWSEMFKAQGCNQLLAVDQKMCQAVGGDPNVFYLHGYWELAADEALIIDVTDIPACETWNYQLDNYWMESLDYRYFPITVNKNTAVYNADGSVRIIVAHGKPEALGVRKVNWMDTAGHCVGTHCFRWIGAKEYPVPEVKIVKFVEL